MSEYQPVVFVVPEDRANLDVANGFLLDPGVRLRAVKLARVARGWTAVREELLGSIAPKLRQNTRAFAVLLVDFDGQTNRREMVLSGLDPSLADRVFVLGSLTEPEPLKRDLGSFETIGKRLARDCAEGTSTAWGHALLKHNEAALVRLRPVLHPVLFAAP